MNDEKKQARKEERAKKRTQRAVAKKIHQLKKEDRKNRFSRNNTNPTPEGVSPKRQARRLNKASNPSEGVKKMGDGYGKSRKPGVSSGPTSPKSKLKEAQLKALRKNKKKS